MSNAIITTAGRDYFAQRAGESLPVNINRFLLCNISDLDIDSDPNPDESIPDSTTHVREIDVTQSGYVNAHQVVYSLFLGTQEGDYTFNWVGLLSDDGVLVAVRYIDPYTKRATANGETGNQITRNFLIAYTDAQQLMNVTVDAATWQFDFNLATEENPGLVERATLRELYDGEDDERYATPRGLRAWVIDNLYYDTETGRPLSAKQGSALRERLEVVEQNTPQHDSLAEDLSISAVGSNTIAAREMSTDTIHSVKGYVRVLSVSETGVVFNLYVSGYGAEVNFVSLSITTLQDSVGSEAPTFYRINSSSDASIRILPEDVPEDTFAIAFEGTVKATFEPFNNTTRFYASVRKEDDIGTIIVGAGSYLSLAKVG